MEVSPTLPRTNVSSRVATSSRRSTTRRSFSTSSNSLRSGIVAAGVCLAGAGLAATFDERPDLAAVFAAQRTPGTFALYDVAADRFVVVDRDRAKRRFIPASTFKIVNSLIALETGAVRDEKEVLPYGGKPQPFAHWEKDMDMREAIRASNVAVYQEIARRIGLERMHSYVQRLSYGNARIGTVVDRFWLDGPLEINAFEQVMFVGLLAQGKLPLSPRSQSIVRDMLQLERKGDGALYGKTGWIFQTGKQLGWWVGWVEKGGRIHSFALNIDMASADDAPKRVAIGRELLARLGIFPNP